MARFSDDQLRDKALYALEEVYGQCQERPAEPTEALRFALAYLANDAADRKPFDAFWRAVTGVDDKGQNPTIVDGLRRSRAMAALRGIYMQLGCKRED